MKTKCCTKLGNCPCDCHDGDFKGWIVVPENGICCRPCHTMNETKKDCTCSKWQRHTDNAAWDCPVHAPTEATPNNSLELGKYKQLDVKVTSEGKEPAKEWRGKFDKEFPELYKISADHIKAFIAREMTAVEEQALARGSETCEHGRLRKICSAVHLTQEEAFEAGREEGARIGFEKGALSNHDASFTRGVEAGYKKGLEDAFSGKIENMRSILVRETWEVPPVLREMIRKEGKAARDIEVKYLLLEKLKTGSQPKISPQSAIGYVKAIIDVLAQLNPKDTGHKHLNAENKDVY